MRLDLTRLDRGMRQVGYSTFEGRFSASEPEIGARITACRQRTKLSSQTNPGPPSAKG